MTLETLISAHELSDLQKSADVLVVDCRFDLSDPARGEREYLDAHIPGAVYADLERDLSEHVEHGVGRHPLPSDRAFSALLSRWGWRAGMRVVCYDTAHGALAAARLWWLLRLAGITDAGVLDGGLAAWKDAGGALESGPVHRNRSEVAVRLDRTRVVWFDELDERRANGSAVLVDARAAQRYRGEVEPIDPKAGHVPAALNRPFANNLDPNGRFKPRAQLREELTSLMHGRTPEDIVHMCGSGVTACHNLLAMEYAGLRGSRVFAPSWSGWVSDPDRPVAKGA